MNSKNLTQSPPTAPQTGEWHASEQVFKLLVQSVREYSIFVIDKHGLVETWNEGAKLIKGYTAAEILGKPYEIFFTAEDCLLGKPRHILQEASIHGSYHDEGWRVRKDGSTFWASATLTKLLDEQGNLRGFAKVTHDDTARHLAAEDLRRSEERFRLAVSALREHAFYMLDVDGHVRSWNIGAERHKGYTESEIIGQHFSIFFTDDDKVSGKPMRELAIAKQMGSFEEEGWRVRKDGTRFWAAIVITTIHDEKGELRGFVKVTRDETHKHEDSLRLQQTLERARIAEQGIRTHVAELEKRVAERTELLSRETDKLTKTNAELEQFAYIVSHDLKEPLRTIAGYLELLFSKYLGNLDERAKDYADKITDATKRMRQLIDGILEYSVSNDVIDISEIVDLNEVVKMAIANQTFDIRKGAIHLENHGLPTVRANRLHLARVFQNLIANSVKFQSADILQIRINAKRENDTWIISITDNGIGIDPTLHSRLFKVFQRLHAAEQYPGTGIGLATCKKIIEHHGGRIWVESALGKGTTFKFTLPYQA